MTAERVLWAGQPGGGRVRLRAHDYLFVPLSLAWSTVIVVALFTVLVQGTWGTPSGAAVLLMTLSALYLVAGRFVVDAYVRRRTSYTLTEREVTIVCDALGTKTTTLPLERIRQIALRERRNGSGTIILGRGSWWVDETPVGMRAGPAAPRLEEIADVRRVYETIQSLRLAPPFAIALEGVPETAR